MRLAGWARRSRELRRAADRALCALGRLGYYGRLCVSSRHCGPVLVRQRSHRAEEHQRGDDGGKCGDDLRHVRLDHDVLQRGRGSTNDCLFLVETSPVCQTGHRAECSRSTIRGESAVRRVTATSPVLAAQRVDSCSGRGDLRGAGDEPLVQFERRTSPGRASLQPPSSARAWRRRWRCRLAEPVLGLGRPHTFRILPETEAVRLAQRFERFRGAGVGEQCASIGQRHKTPTTDESARVRRRRRAHRLLERSQRLRRILQFEFSQAALGQHPGQVFALDVLGAGKRDRLFRCARGLFEAPGEPQGFAPGGLESACSRR